jgi:hypothetical protein
VAKHTIDLKIDFNNKADAVALLNFIEGKKSVIHDPTNDTIKTGRSVRYYTSRHDEAQPTQDGPATYIDFDAAAKTFTEQELPETKS